MVEIESNQGVSDHSNESSSAEYFLMVVFAFHHFSNRNLNSFLILEAPGSEMLT